MSDFYLCTGFDGIWFVDGDALYDFPGNICYIVYNIIFT